MARGDIVNAEDYCRRFDAYMTGLGHTPDSRRLRRKYAQRFMAEHDLATVGVSGIVQFMGNPRWKPQTRASARAALRALFVWAKLEGIRADNPMEGIPTIRVFQAPPRPTPESVLEEALEKSTQPGVDRRAHLVLLLGAYAGLRRAEIVRLRVESIQEDGRLRVLGKGGKTRLVPIHPALVEPLREACRWSRDGWLFPSPLRDGPCDPVTINRILRGVLPRGFSTHGLRHRFATQVHSRSKDLRAVQTLLGHSSLATTQRYVGVTDQDLVDAVETLIEF